MVRLGSIMRLYIGKKYEGAAPVQSIFRLAGNDEDALTYALGFLLARDPIFCRKLVRLIRRVGVAVPRAFERDYSVHLQEITGRGYGRRDIAIVAGKMRIVIEAKVGGAEPTADQLLKYAAESELWDQFRTRAIVALTKVELAAATKEEAHSKLSDMGITFSSLQWHQVAKLVLDHQHSDDSEVSRYLFDEFRRYIRRHYDVGYYDAEILIQDVNPKNAEIFKEGWMYVTAPRDKKAPLYFAPYFTRQGANSGISVISRVRDANIVVLAETETVLDAPSSEHLERWQRGLAMLRKRAEEEGFSHGEVRLLFLDQPISIGTTPLTKKASKEAGMSKQIPSQIPKGFTLRFDDLLRTLPMPPAS